MKAALRIARQLALFVLIVTVLTVGFVGGMGWLYMALGPVGVGFQ